MEGISRLTFGPAGVTSVAIFHPHYAPREVPKPWEGLYKPRAEPPPAAEAEAEVLSRLLSFETPGTPLQLGELSPEMARQYLSGADLAPPPYILASEEEEGTRRRRRESEEEVGLPPPPSPRTAEEEAGPPPLQPRRPLAVPKRRVTRPDPGSEEDPFGIRDLSVKPPREPPRPQRPSRRLPRLPTAERPGAAGPATWKTRGAGEAEAELEETRKYWRRRRRMLDTFQSRTYYRYEVPTICRLVSSKLPELFSPPCLSTTPMYEWSPS